MCAYAKAFVNDAGAFHSVLLCDPFCVALVHGENMDREMKHNVNVKSTLFIAHLNPVICSRQYM